jgi:hypothetical protein
LKGGTGRFLRERISAEIDPIDALISVRARRCAVATAKNRSHTNEADLVADRQRVRATNAIKDHIRDVMTVRLDRTSGRIGLRSAPIDGHRQAVPRQVAQPQVVHRQVVQLRVVHLQDGHTMTVVARSLEEAGDRQVHAATVAMTVPVGVAARDLAAEAVIGRWGRSAREVLLRNAQVDRLAAVQKNGRRSANAGTSDSNVCHGRRR